MEESVKLQLHKLSAIKSEEAVDELLTALWKSRRCGLPFPDKSRLHSLLNLPSLGDLDPVLFFFFSCFYLLNSHN
ncbi:hypothetical protein M5689_009394 [Euphorbia peplus]|nr:hypothetical protein M5689_009394 [Euphorbia peplus]